MFDAAISSDTPPSRPPAGPIAQILTVSALNILAREALEAGYGVAPVDIGVGGSIPFIADLVREFRRPDPGHGRRRPARAGAQPE